MTVYYVGTNGNDSANGGSSSPFRTIQHALNSGLNPGDEVVVRAGTYREALNINDGGSASANVTIRAEEPGTVLLRPPSGSWNGISVNDDYVTVQGFDIANAQGDGIEANNVHHIEVLDNVSHGNGESGIQFNWSDFIRIEGNTTYENASDGWFSGISVYQNRNITGDTTTEGFRTIVRNNESYDNVTQTGQHTDGNGIIIDDFQSTQTSGFPNYTYPTLVENNLVYLNGGKGVQVVWSDSVTVRGNTAYHNNQDLLNSGTWRGEISNSQSSNNVFVNNIAVADPSVNSNNTALDNTSYGGYSNDVVWANNLTFNGISGRASVRTDGDNDMPKAAAGNLLGVDPRFVDAPTDFHLRSDSPAIDNGTGQYGLWQFDLDMTSRERGTVDIGAYEIDSGNAPNPDSGSSNTDPSAIDDAGFTTTSGELIRIELEQLLSNDTDADGNTLKVTSVANATNGSVNLFGDSVTFTPSQSYSGNADFDYRISDGNGGNDWATVSVSVVQPTEPVTPPNQPGVDFNLWDTTVTPDVEVTSDTGAVELGLRFTADVDAELVGLRIYRGEDATGLSAVNLWSGTGQRVATTAVSETGAGGWQEVMFDNAVELEAGESYVASYYTQSGNYAFEVDFFDAPRDAGPISLDADAGVFRYGGNSSFPEESYDSANYFIDPMLTVPTPAAPVRPSDPTPDTVIGEAGVAVADQRSGSSWTRVNFDTALDDPSVVMGGFTGNGSQPYAVRVRNVSDSGFEYQIDEWDYLDGRHTTERISWMAIESGIHRLADGRVVEAGNATATDSWTNIDFDGAMSGAPVVLAQATGSENAHALTDRIRSVDGNGFEMRVIDEEASTTRIAAQGVDWIAIGQGGSANSGALARSTERAVSQDEFEFEFGGSFTDTDFALVTDMQSQFGGDPATLQTVSTTRESAVLRVLEERSADAETRHADEVAGYAAFETGLIGGTTIPADDLIA